MPWRSDPGFRRFSPGASTDLKKYPDEIKVGFRAKVDRRGAVG